VTTEPPYNPIFTRFVPQESETEEPLQGLIAYGLYKIAKREWASRLWQKEQRKPNEEELKSYVDTWTDSRLKGVEQQAETALARYAEIVVEAATPQIREDALRGTTWKSIQLSIAANFIYTLLLIALFFVLRLAGVDLISILTSVGSPAK